MAKYVDMSGFNELTDNLEEFVSKQGCTLGKDAERLQELLHSMIYCYLHGVVTDSQVEQMNKKFVKQFQKALYEME